MSWPWGTMQKKPALQRINKLLQNVYVQKRVIQLIHIFDILCECTLWVD